MKKIFKSGWIILVLGLIALGIGYFNGGNKSVIFNGARPVVITNHVRHLSTNKAFDQLNLDASTADVVIKRGNKYQVTYYGMAGQIPKAKLNGNRMTVKQQGNLKILFNVVDYQNKDLIVITIPKGHALTGNIRVASGDLNISNVDLTDAMLNIDSGDVNYDHVSLSGGKTTLYDGDFRGQQLTVKGHYSIVNHEGDNTVTNTQVDGYHLDTDDGENNLNGQDKGDQTLNMNESASNVLRLINFEGDNDVN